MKTIIKSDLSIFTPFALDTFCHKVVLGCIDYCKQLLRTWSITYQERNVFFCVVFFQKRGNALKGIIHLVCLQKTYISYRQIRKRTCAYQGLRNISFSENFAYVPNEWFIDGALELLHHYQVSQFFGELSQLL